MSCLAKESRNVWKLEDELEKTRLKKQTGMGRLLLMSRFEVNLNDKVESKRNHKGKNHHILQIVSEISWIKNVSTIVNLRQQNCL